MDRQMAMLIREYFSVQKHRLSFGSQLRELKAAPKSKKKAKNHGEFYDDFYKIEKNIVKEITKQFKAHPMYAWLKSARGIGPIIGCALLTFVDIKKAQHASSLWKYCGLAPGQKRTRGEKLDYNPMMKQIAFKIGESFVKKGGKYREIYDTSKLFYKKKFPEPVKDPKSKRIAYTPIHIDRMAKRRAVKMFLSHFWAEWREMEGLPVSEPFAHRIAI